MAMAAAGLAVAVAGCGSGPPADAVPMTTLASTTTTTRALGDDIGSRRVTINRVGFNPASIKMDLIEIGLIEIVNNDGATSFTVMSTEGLFEDVVVTPGQTHTIDFREYERGLYELTTLVLGRPQNAKVDTRVDEE